MSRTGIRHLSVTLGDDKVWYRDLPDIETRIRELNIPDEEGLWNWGYCRRWSADYDTQIAQGFAQTIAYVAAARIHVDAVLCCGPVQNSTDRFLDALASGVLPKMATSADPVRRVERGECVNVLQALGDAKALIDAGHDHVLIVAAEKVVNERSRFRKNSLLSDFCLALLVSSHLDQCECEILDVLITADPDPGDDTSGILVRNLEKRCVASVLASTNVALGDVRKLFYLNLFEPIAEMKGQHTGFRASQLYLAMTKESGHCYGADPFINMRGYAAASRPGDTYVLCASAREYAAVAAVGRLR
jgi:hypothetical protein